MEKPQTKKTDNVSPQLNKLQLTNLSTLECYIRENIVMKDPELTMECLGEQLPNEDIRKMIKDDKNNKSCKLMSKVMWKLSPCKEEESTWKLKNIHNLITSQLSVDFSQIMIGISDNEESLVPMYVEFSYIKYKFQPPFVILPTHCDKTLESIEQCIAKNILMVICLEKALESLQRPIVVKALELLRKKKLNIYCFSLIKPDSFEILEMLKEFSLLRAVRVFYKSYIDHMLKKTPDCISNYDINTVPKQLLKYDEFIQFVTIRDGPFVSSIKEDDNKVECNELQSSKGENTSKLPIIAVGVDRGLFKNNSGSQKDKMDKALFRIKQKTLMITQSRSKTQLGQKVYQPLIEDEEVIRNVLWIR